MLDPVVCEGLREVSDPEIVLDALLALRAVLDAQPLCEPSDASSSGSFPPHEETTLSHKAHPTPRQTALPLDGEVQWMQLPPEVRDRSRALVVELLAGLARLPSTGGDDNER